jgi:hypothetical protein
VAALHQTDGRQQLQDEGLGSKLLVNLQRGVDSLRLLIIDTRTE